MVWSLFNFVIFSTVLCVPESVRHGIKQRGTCSSRTDDLLRIPRVGWARKLINSQSPELKRGPFFQTVVKKSRVTSRASGNAHSHVVQLQHSSIICCNIFLKTAARKRKKNCITNFGPLFMKNSVRFFWRVLSKRFSIHLLTFFGVTIAWNLHAYILW